MVILFNKPWGVLSQFTDAGNLESDAATLSVFIDVPNVYAAGRLDKDSEGLLVLTDDGLLQAKIADPKNKMSKTYWVQVEGAPVDADLALLRTGIKLKDGMTAPAKVRLMEPPADLWPRVPPIGARQLDRDHDHRRAQPASAADDGGGGISDAAADPVSGGQLDN
jgi:23S rRNA pseudouridine2457 synthase